MRIRSLKPGLLTPVLALLAVSMLTTFTSTASAHEGREIGELELVVGFLVEPAIEAQPNGALIRVKRPAIDIETHGALFSSGTVSPGGEYDFLFDERLEDLEIPFHDHLTGNGGTITVSHDAGVSEMVTVNFDRDFSPSALTIEPGTTVRFINTSENEVMTVLSGPHDRGDGHEHEGDPGHMDGEPVLGLSSTLEVEVVHLPTGETRTMDLRPLFGEDGTYVADFMPTAPGGYSFRFFGEIDGSPFDETFESGPGTFDEVIPARSIQFPIELRETRELQGAIEGMQAQLARIEADADDSNSLATIALIVGIVGIAVGTSGAGLGGYLILRSRTETA